MSGTGINSYLSLNNSLQTQFVFVGFGSANYYSTGTSTLYDIDLINQDLTYAFGTRVGERVMRPDFGCRIWEYFMNPMDDFTTGQIISEAQRIIALDTRLVQQSIDIYEIQNGITVQLTLLYQPFNVIGTFQATFNANENAYFNSN